MAGSPLQRQAEWGAIATAVHAMPSAWNPFDLHCRIRNQDNATPQ
jgi:hypothetical protein